MTTCYVPVIGEERESCACLLHKGTSTFLTFPQYYSDVPDPECIETFCKTLVDCLPTNLKVIDSVGARDRVLAHDACVQGEVLLEPQSTVDKMSSTITFWDLVQMLEVLVSKIPYAVQMFYAQEVGALWGAGGITLEKSAHLTQALSVSLVDDPLFVCDQKKGLSTFFVMGTPQAFAGVTDPVYAKSVVRCMLRFLEKAYQQNLAELS